MFSLQDLLGQQQGNEAVDQISQNVGADNSAVNSAIQMALPMILNSLANNAATPQGAQSLDNALANDYNDGGVLGNLGGLAGMIFGGGQQAAPPPRQADAGGILGHILGGNQGASRDRTSRADSDVSRADRDGLSRQAKAGKRSGRGRTAKYARRAAAANSAIAAGRIFKQYARPRRRRQFDGRYCFDGIQIYDQPLV